jgi:drug/metabolite transporter (DMT)-like permease
MQLIGDQQSNELGVLTNNIKKYSIIIGFNLLGTILSLSSAATFGMNAAVIRRGVLSGSVIQGMAISLGIGFPFFILIAILTESSQHIWEFSPLSYCMLVTAGIIHFAFGRYCNYRAVKAMGGILVRPLQNLSVILSITLAILFLDETLTPMRIFGIALILLGPIIMLRDHKNFKNKMQKKNKHEIKSRIKFIPNYTEGIIFGIGSALAFGSSPVLVSAAIVKLDYTAGIAGGVISYGAAALIVLIISSKPANIHQIIAISMTSIRWFSVGALLIGVSQMLRYMALAVAPVSIVAPIQQTTVIFQVIFSWLINRDHEAFGVWVILGIFCSLLGAIILSVSTEIILTHIDFPKNLGIFTSYF